MKVGDRVKVIHKTNERYGQEGVVVLLWGAITIVRFAEYDPYVGEPFKDVWFEDDEIELVASHDEKKQKEKNMSNYKLYEQPNNLYCIMHNNKLC